MKLRILGALTALLVATNVSAAGYIKFEGIDGEAMDKDHKGWSDILSVSGLASPRDAASGMATGKRQHKPITITKRVDQATPALAQWHQDSNQKPRRVEILQGGTTTVLEGVRVLSVERSGDTEIVSLSYQSARTQASSRAQDYNSSRSNNTSLKAAAAPANHNTTRSNRTVE